MAVPALVVVAYRDAEIGRRHPLAGSLRALARTPRFERLSLTGLPPGQVRVLLGASLGRAPPRC